jgi:parallel beta-helix repeat protein
MKKNILKITLYLLLIIPLGLNFKIPTTKANPRVIYVDGNNITGPWDGTPEHPYQNITSGLTYASQGDTIFVYNGTYYEHLIITKLISLQGQNKHDTIIDGNQTGDVIKITANNVNITEFTIQNSGSTSGESGIHVYSSSGNNINHNIIKDNYAGIFLYDSNNNTLTNNSITNNYYGISLSASNTNTISENTISSNTKSGIYISDSSNATISDNNILKNDEFGVAFIASSNSRFTGNDISLNNKYGIYLFNSNNNNFSDNNISSNQEFGIWLSKSTKNLLADNIFSNDKFGIYVTNSTHNIFTKNSVYTNIQHGIRLDYSTNNTISGNDISKNWIRGILLYYSSNNTIFHNNFINNTGSLTNINSTNSLDNGIEGNYWSNYNGTDEDQNGIGNSPYIIDANNQDKYPLMGTFSDFTVIHEKNTYHVSTICNSTISQFQFNETLKMLKFNITGANNTKGFCRIQIPEQLTNRPHIVLVDDEQVNATLLPPSNITHTFLYFTYNHSTREIKILSKPYYELLKKYNTLLENYQNLNSTHYQLLADYASLNQTYQETLNNYTKLQEEYHSLWEEFNALNQTYQETLTNYTHLQADYASLNQKYQQALASYTQLLADYNILNQAYQETLNNYTKLQEEYHSLWEEFNALNQTYQQTLTNYTKLSANYNILNKTYEKTLNNYTQLIADHNLLNQIYQELMANHTQLKNDYLSIQTGYNALLVQYNLLNSTYNKIESEYANTRTTLWYVSIVAITITVITSSLTINYRRKAEEQKKIAEKYKSELERVSLIDTARAQFEADAKRRKEKIRKFQNKYGVTVRPRDTLEDIITSLELKKEKSQQ